MNIGGELLVVVVVGYCGYLFIWLEFRIYTKSLNGFWAHYSLLNLAVKIYVVYEVYVTRIVVLCWGYEFGLNFEF